MVKYKVNLKFKEDGKSLNEIITEVLKILSSQFPIPEEVIHCDD